ncbi:MAG: FMN-binding protein [Flavobacteriaceae bacterium]|nr:MAG: FMN-binding protein [Flavobacteriaceae bacterium]
MKKVTFITILVFIITSFTVSDKIEALIQKEIKTVLKIESFSKQSVIISKELNETLPLKITNTNFYKINNNDSLLGYYYLGQAFGKTDYFDFIVIFDAKLIVVKVKVLKYREERGGEVGSKRWLKQFIGKSSSNNLKYQKDIAAISGATISAKSMTNKVNKLFKTIAILNTNKQL